MYHQVEFSPAWFQKKLYLHKTTALFESYLQMYGQEVLSSVKFLQRFCRSVQQGSAQVTVT